MRFVLPFAVILFCAASGITQAQWTQPASEAPGFAKPHAIPAPPLKFSKHPTDLEITSARVFLGPLVPMAGKAHSGENGDLGAALIAYRSRSDAGDISALKSFLAKYPDSRWKASLEFEMGRISFETGYLSDALAYWQAAWNDSNKETDPARKAVADAALGQLVLLNARLGRTSELEGYIAGIKGRKLDASAAGEVRTAHEGLLQMKNVPSTAFKCGPYAVDTIANIGRPAPARSKLVEKAASTTQGTNLVQVQNWAKELGLNYQMAKRDKGAPFIVPAVMHWKLGHFAAVTKELNGKYHVEDPTFGPVGQFWIGSDALEAETDGYFLVPAGPLPQGWSSVDEKEGAAVWGKGAADGRDPGRCPAPTNNGQSSGCTSCAKKGGPMAAAVIYNMQATNCVYDTPLSYTPALGPVMAFGVNYNYLEPNQPGTLAFTSFGQDWSFNWFGYLTVDASQNLTVRVPSGGSEVYNYNPPNNVTNPYSPNLLTQAVMVLVAAGVYERQLPDGSVEIYNKADGAGRIYMTQVIDPQGNTVNINYDASYRVSTIVDAVSGTTTLSYASGTAGTNAYYSVSRITDPFGRFTSFTYDTTYSNLLSITDVIGITSTFTYDTGSPLDSGPFLDSLVTPYGRTLFYQYIPAGDPTQLARGMKVIFPDGTTSVTENWLGDVPTPQAKSTFYWDRHAMQLYPNDPANEVYTHCEVTHWLLEPASSILGAVPASYQPPLESQVNYTYPNQGVGSDSVGTINQPSTASRLTDSGTQTYQYQYNALGTVTHSIDPVGRTFSYYYAANNIDLLEARQTSGTNNDLIGKWEFANTQHRPTLSINGSGQQTSYAYNAAGQITSVTNALGSGSNTTTFTYNGTTSQLMTIQGPAALAHDTTGFTYDSYGRVHTVSTAVTSTTNYTLAYAYDAANRITQITYPDGTYNQTVYVNLDPTLFRDRIGNWTQRGYDSLRELVFETDPLGRTTKYAWCTCGALATLTDPNGNVTTWQHDLEGRVVQKTFSDSTSASYVYSGDLSWLMSSTDALGQVKNFAYNLDNTLSQVSYASAVNPTSTVNYTYDPNYLRLTSAQNGWGTVGYTYNPYITDPFASGTTGGGLLQSATNSVIANSAISYSYDVLNRITSQAINGSANTDTWNLDPIGRVTSGSSVLGSGTYNYLDPTTGTFLLGSVNYPNGQVTDYTWSGSTGDFRLQEIKNLTPSASVLSQFDYTYDGNGNILTGTTQQSGTTSTWNYGYDFAQQLTAAVVTGTATGTVQYFYNYDAAANRISEQINTATTSGVNVTSGSFNTVNELKSLSAGGETRFSGTISKPGTVNVSTNAAFMVWSQSFVANPSLNAGTNNVPVAATDGSGNVTTNTYAIVVPSGSGTQTLSYDNDGNLINDGTNSYSWDAENRLVKIVYSNTINYSQFTYDPLSRLAEIVEIASGTTASTKQFIWCGSQMCEARDGSSNVTARYFASGEQISGTNYYYTKDQLGSIREMTDGSGNIQAQYAYDPYGVVTQLQGSMSSDFQYAGYYEHLPSALNLSLYRPYSASFGRWITRDPIAEPAFGLMPDVYGSIGGGFIKGPFGEMIVGSNLYDYVLNNPVNETDSSGLDVDSPGPVDAEIAAQIAQVDATQAGELSAADAAKAAKAAADAARNAQKASDVIAKECKGSINREFPSEMRDKALSEIKKLAQQGLKAAQKAMKLLNSKEYKK